LALYNNNKKYNRVKKNYLKEIYKQVTDPRAPRAQGQGGGGTFDPPDGLTRSVNAPPPALLSGKCYHEC